MATSAVESSANRKPLSVDGSFGYTFAFYMGNNEFIDDGAGNYYWKLGAVDISTKSLYSAGFGWFGAHTGTLWRPGLQNAVWGNSSSWDNVFAYHFNSDYSDIYFLTFRRRLMVFLSDASGFA